MLQAILSQMPGSTSLDDLLDRTAATLHQLMANAVTAVFQVQPGGMALYACALKSEWPELASRTIASDYGLIGASVSSGQTVVVQDTSADPRYRPVVGWRTRAELCVPIMTRAGLWGVLDLQSPHVGAYPPWLAQMAEIVAQQLAIAVENTALVDQAQAQAHLLERHARELTQILTLNSQLRASMDMDTLLQHLADSIRTVMGFQSVVVNLVDEQANRVWVAAMAGCTEEEQAILRDATYVWDGFFGEQPERFLVSHSYFMPAEAGFQISGAYVTAKVDQRAPHEWQADDMLMIPVVGHGGEVLGVFSVDDPKDRQRPSVPTIQGLEIFASQAAAAIENARLFAQTQDALNALRQAHERQAQLLEDIRITQAELITASKLAAVGTLAAGVAHEFNNLLAGMHGYAELGQAGTQVDKDEALEVIRRTCLRGVQITRGLLTFARQGDGKRELARIDEIAEAALQLISWDLSKAGVAVVRDFGSAALIWADSGQIMQVALNLLTNARDAMRPGGGTVTIATREAEDWVELVVADTGSGIPDQIREHIFEPFVTTKGALGGSMVAGTGLGLAVSYGIVQSHEGQLLVESVVGQGSRFSVRLPRGVGTPSIEASAPALRSAARSHRILVVDDEAEVRAMLVALLGRAGHTVDHATDGQEAVERAEHEQWELIVSDMTMPRLDGPGMLQQLRARGIATPVILITGRVDSEGLARARASDACAVLAKPFEAAKLLAMVAAALE
jgi:signal transduction histidine kinase/putative methionine-R-sulfoxide reductase with GAF domain